MQFECVGRYMSGVFRRRGFVYIPGYRGRSALGSSRARCLDVEVSVWLLDIEMPVGLGAWISRLPSDWVPGLAL